MRLDEHRPASTDHERAPGHSHQRAPHCRQEGSQSLRQGSRPSSDQRPALRRSTGGSGWLGLLAILVLGIPAAWAQSSASQRQAAQADYRREVRACESSAATQDRTTCLREARSARADQRRGALTTASQETLQTNALARCQVFAPGPDMEACRARVMGEGSSTGSVSGGGILREYAVTVPLEPSPAQTEMGAPPASAPRMDTQQEPQGATPDAGQGIVPPQAPQTQQPQPGEMMHQDMHRDMHPPMHPQMQPRMQQQMQTPMQPQMQAPPMAPAR